VIPRDRQPVAAAPPLGYRVTRQPSLSGFDSSLLDELWIGRFVRPSGKSFILELGGAAKTNRWYRAVISIHLFKIITSQDKASFDDRRGACGLRHSSGRCARPAGGGNRNEPTLRHLPVVNLTKT
jgi:hypothetical protein